MALGLDLVWFAQNNLINLFISPLGNFVRKILQPAFHLIASEDDDMTPETTGREFTRFSETSSEQGTCFSKMSTNHDVGEGWTSNSEKLGRLGSAQQSSPDLLFLIVKNDMGEKRLFVDLGRWN